MGWSRPKVWIEVRNSEIDFLEEIGSGGDEGENWSFQIWKIFLLGHGKYGSLPHLEPIKELKGLPEDTHEEIREFQQESGGKIELDYGPTYYSLKELRDFDPSKKVPMPKPSQSKGGFVGINPVIELPSGEKKEWMLQYFKQETLSRVIEDGGESDVIMYKTNKSWGEDGIITSWTKERRIEDGKLERGDYKVLEAKLKLERNTYEGWYSEFADFLDYMDQKRKEISSEHTVSREDIRLVIVPIRT